MLITQLSSYLMQQHRAALLDLAQHLDVDVEVLRGPLALMEQAGQVRRLPTGTPCSGCCQCDPQKIEIYEWIAPIAIALPAN